MLDYSYLDWGRGLSPSEENVLETDYQELANLLEANASKEDVDVNFNVDEKKEDDDYNVWFIAPGKEHPWGSKELANQERRDQVIRQIRELVDEIKPGHPLWNWNDTQFLDMFLLADDINDVTQTKYDSVLLVAPDHGNVGPLAVIWEMVPIYKRCLLLNLQRGGCKLAATFSDYFTFPEEGIICLEVYMKKS